MVETAHEFKIHTLVCLAQEYYDFHDLIMLFRLLFLLLAAYNLRIFICSCIACR